MTPSRSQHDKTHRADRVSTLAKSLAPEEICAGDYVAVLHVVHEFPALLWCSDTSLVGHDEIVRLPFVPENSGVPLLVKSVCLPFVLVKHPCGKRRPLDVRHCRLARLDRAYAKATCRAYREDKSKKRGRNRRKKKAG